MVFFKPSVLKKNSFNQFKTVNLYFLMYYVNNIKTRVVVFPFRWLR